VSGFSERDAIKFVLKFLDLEGFLPRGDDVADLPIDGRILGLKIDGFSAHNSKLPWNSWSDFGWKAVTAVISDFIAKGGEALAIVVSLGLPLVPESEQIFKETIEGIKEATKTYRVAFLGGDTNSSQRDIWIDVAGLCSFEKKPIPRNGAKPGDSVIIIGEYGLTGAAFHAFYNNHINVITKFKKILRATSRPLARLQLLEIFVKHRDYISSSMDVSDGLAFTLKEIAEASNVAIRLDKLPLANEAIEYAKLVGVKPIDLAFYGGEEFEVVFTVSKDHVQEIIRELSVKSIPYTLAGEVIEGDGEVYYRGIPVEKRGWNHFRALKPL